MSFMSNVIRDNIVIEKPMIDQTRILGKKKIATKFYNEGWMLMCR